MTHLVLKVSVIGELSEDVHDRVVEALHLFQLWVLLDVVLCVPEKKVNVEISEHPTLRGVACVDAHTV
jgi:hypothetical protein